MKYQVVKDFVHDILESANFVNIDIHPGPALPDVPNEYVLLTPYGGSGLEQDGLFDVRAWQVRTVGKQGDYSSAEDMADAIDLRFISHLSGKISGVHTASITRVGGAPNPLMVDDADRTHFTCNYNIDSVSALVN